MRTFVVLAMHGSPPNDFPSRELGEFFALHSKLESGAPVEAGQRARYEELEERIRDWPRNRANDPFHAGSTRLASEIEQALGMPVIVGFNEFCGPDLETAFEQAGGATRRASDRGHADADPRRRAFGERDPPSD